MTSARRLFRHLLHALDNFGAAEVLRRLVRGRTLNLESTAASPGRHPFDLRHGTETSGYLPGAQLLTGSKADLYNSAYYGSSPSTLAAALTHLPEPPEDFTFYDVGCGKGRALLVASAVPFHRIEGVELAPALAAVARQNTAHVSRIVVTVGDAAHTPFPAGPLLVFLYHPFLRPMLRRVLGNLLQQRRAQRHATYVLYSNCTYPRVMRSVRALAPVWDKTFTLSDEDATAHHFGATEERYQLWRLL